MAVHYTDTEIQALLSEQKVLQEDYRARVALRPKRGHKEGQTDVSGAAGSEFRVILRLSDENPLDFSVILACLIPRSNRWFRLRRYNGKSHEHSNPIEGERFYDYHIHTATERYQALGAAEDAFAQPTDRYATWDEALRCLFEDCGFQVPPKAQLPLLEEH